MLEQIARVSHSIEIHLLYASIVWLGAWLLTSMQRGSATTKYWIWVATSLNFIVPLSLLPDRFWPSLFVWFAPQIVIPRVESVVSGSARATAVILIAWAVGAFVMAARLGFRLVADRRDAGGAPARNVRDTRPAFLSHGVAVRFDPNRRGPAVEGVLHPQICLPEGMDELLTAQEFDAVLIHEVRHARRRDNLIRLIHEVSLCALWFHPLAWITRSRLALYRELSCDESVTHRACGGDLVSALAKLANPENALLLQSTASSFISHRLPQLLAREPQRRVSADTMLTVTFCAVLLAGAAGPVAQAAASYACALSHPHAPLGGVRGGVAGGVSGGVRAGIKGGVPGGISGGVQGGVSGGVSGGVTGGIRGGIS